MYMYMYMCACACVRVLNKNHQGPFPKLGNIACIYSKFTPYCPCCLPKLSRVQVSGFFLRDSKSRVMLHGPPSQGRSSGNILDGENQRHSRLGPQKINGSFRRPKIKTLQYLEGFLRNDFPKTIWNWLPDILEVQNVHMDVSKNNGTPKSSILIPF